MDSIHRVAIAVRSHGKGKAKKQKAELKTIAVHESNHSHPIGGSFWYSSRLIPLLAWVTFPYTLPRWKRRGLTHTHLGAHATRAKTRPPRLGGLDMQHIEGGRLTPGAAHT